VIALLFALPWWWPAVLVLPVLAWWATRQETRQAARTQVVFGRREVALLGARCWQRTKRVCGVLSGLFCGLALLCPIWGDGPGEPAGPDVVLCLDVSRSMRARDLEPDRLGTAQREIVTLTQQAFGARLGLVVFAGTAQLAVPLTADLESVAVLAVAMDPSSVARGGSDLGAAIDTASAALERSHAVAGSMVVLTDGEDFSGAARAAAERARARGIIVHCLGFGTSAGSKIVVDTPDGEVFLRDATGADVVTTLDVGSLAAVAEAGGGTFAVAAPDALARLYAQSLLPRAESVAALDPDREHAHRFQWPLLAALLFWMLASVMPQRRRGGR
jgi:Ca-activated chloride channel homolog